MKKEKGFLLTKYLAEMASKPLRSREQAILLILYTIRMLRVGAYVQGEGEDKAVFTIEKMNRISYVLDNKIFSFQFPFSIEFSDDGTYRVYDNKTHIDIDSVVLSKLIAILEKMNNSQASFEDIFDIIMEDSDNNVLSAQDLWDIISRIMTYDLGYLRYDYDKEHENGRVHPLNHLDIFYDSAAACKIGLPMAIDYSVFIDILNTETECAYLEIGT